MPWRALLANGTDLNASTQPPGVPPHSRRPRGDGWPCGQRLSRETFESQIEKGFAWIGTPEEIRRSIDSYHGSVGGFECASLQVNFGMIGRAEAEASMRLFAREVMPYLRVHEWRKELVSSPRA